MLIAIVSDVHANLEAFQAVLEDMERFKPDKRINLGDLVGYGPNPREVIQLNRDNCFTTLKGNHDAAIADNFMLSKFNSAAQKAISMHRKELSEYEKNYLKNLPINFQHNEIFFVHGFPPNSLTQYVFSDPD